MQPRDGCRGPFLGAMAVVAMALGTTACSGRSRPSPRTAASTSSPATTLQRAEDAGTASDGATRHPPDDAGTAPDGAAQRRAGDGGTTSDGAGRQRAGASAALSDWESRLGMEVAAATLEEAHEKPSPESSDEGAGSIRASAAVGAGSGFDASEFRRAIDRRGEQFTACYRKHVLEDDPDASVKLVVEMVVEVNGDIDSVEVFESSGHEELDACVTGILSSIRLDTSLPGGTLTVRHPFLFKPDEGEPSD